MIASGTAKAAPFAPSRSIGKEALVSLPSFPGFLVDDPEHIPFGAAWLRGITPMRLAALAAVCVMAALSVSVFNFVRGDFWAACTHWLIRTMHYFLAASVMFVSRPL